MPEIHLFDCTADVWEMIIPFIIQMNEESADERDVGIFRIEAIANPFLLLFHLYNIKRLGFHSLISTGFPVLLKPGTAKKSQQKCIVIFALVCCFAILVALIFSAVDIMGEDEDGLSEKNCQNKCRASSAIAHPRQQLAERVSSLFFSPRFLQAGMPPVKEVTLFGDAPTESAGADVD
ncbi:hypothetical protein MG293_013192 [Ovis ammon polii]|uniref:Uncharacterized protein n=1 Tax=Ovis ammon polii TaxID=230172 RepID=A0AAD4U358_OVIAM|nr:hypothetical protein MG293_013192 [Ovis ammon polii]